MSICFVIQPFDGDKFDKRFDDIYKPAIETAGLDAYRVDRDPQVEVPISSIEEGIKNSSICLADITTDNPNVWYELGYAFAAGRPVVMICSDERQSSRYPFDIQHRTIINYKTQSPSDFDELKEEIVKRIKALLSKNETIRQLVESEQLAPRDGLSQPELIVLATVAGDTIVPDSSVSIISVENDVKRAGFNSIAVGLGIQRLIKKKFIEHTIEGDYDGNEYPSLLVTTTGWNWIDLHEDLFNLRVNKKGSTNNKEDFADFDDDIPF